MSCLALREINVTPGLRLKLHRSATLTSLFSLMELKTKSCEQLEQESPVHCSRTMSLNAPRIVVRHGQHSDEWTNPLLQQAFSASTTQRILLQSLLLLRIVSCTSAKIFYCSNSIVFWLCSSLYSSEK